MYTCVLFSFPGLLESVKAVVLESPSKLLISTLSPLKTSPITYTTTLFVPDIGAVSKVISVPLIV